MINEESVQLFELDHGAEAAAGILPCDQPILIELIKVLTLHPRGLRRWSVMRAIRKDRERTSRNIPQKFEDDVERTFRRFCADSVDGKTGMCAANDAFFYRPKEKAGEVWGILPDRAKAWLDAEPVKVADIPKCLRPQLGDW